jgi:PAS domain S-box-containing protein
MSHPQRASDTPPRRVTVAAERHFGDLIRLAPVGIFETNAAGDYLFANERWCELAGMSPDEARGPGWIAALHPEDRARVVHDWYRAAAKGRDFSSEYRFQVGDRATWLHGTATALRDSRGAITGYIGAVADIDERKAVEAALRGAEARLQAVLSSVEDHLVCYDREWRYTFVNDAAARVLGKTKEELIGRSIWELFPEAVGNQYYQELHQAASSIPRRVWRTARP